MSATEIHHVFVNRDAVEHIYRRANQITSSSFDRVERARLTRQALRAVRKRDPRLLIVLDKGAEILSQIAEEQMGRTNRTASTASLRVPPTELNVWREAYKCADAGTAIDPDSGNSPFVGVYAAVCEFAGLA